MFESYYGHLQLIGKMEAIKKKHNITNQYYVRVSSLHLTPKQITLL